MKAAKKVAINAYKKVPKKTLVKKAATLGLKQVLGGPFLDIFGFLYKKSKKKVISYAGSYAYESFFRSEFARTKINAIPISIVSLIIRSILNFLIFSRLQTGIWWLDFPISAMVTIIITLFSPFFYKSIAVHESFFMHYTNIFIDRFLGPGGWEYVDNLKNGLLVLLGVVAIIILEFVKVESRELQQIIIHTLITGLITDQIQKYIERVNKPRRLYYGMTRIDHEDNVHVLGPHNMTQSIPRRANVCHTDNRFIINAKPLRAILIPHDHIRNVKINKSDQPDKRMSPKLLSLFEDYEIV